MTLREEFEKKINIDSLAREDELNHAMAWMYIQWLEDQIPFREQAAWDVRGKTHLVTDDDYNGYHTENVYSSIEEWRKSHTK